MNFYDVRTFDPNEGEFHMTGEDYSLWPGGGAKPYYSDDLVTLYHADCARVLPSVSDVDLVFTSPPYNLGVNPGGTWGHYKDGQIRGGERKWGGVSKAGLGYNEHDDAMPYPEYRDWQRKVLSLCWDSLSDRGAIFYNHRPRVQRDGLLSPLDLNPDLPLRQIVVWAKAGGMNYTPTAYVPTHEWICVFAKPRFRLRSRAASGVGDVWRIPQDTTGEHPASFPVELPARAIETTAPSLVLDPFAGGGSTLLAASRAGVPSVGIEKSERYCELIAARLSAPALGDTLNAPTLSSEASR